MIIAVDGPAASGKGTLAFGLARHFGLPHLDTGLLYRAVGLAVGPDDGAPDYAARAIGAARALDPAHLDTRRLGTADAALLASEVSRIPEVRAALIDFQRDFANQPGGAVLDGRDIGTVIAPEASAKLYVTASPEARAQRRLAELEARGISVHYAEVLADIHARDERDSHRDFAPLARAADADLLDTSDLTVDEAIAAALALVEARLKRGLPSGV